MRGGPETHILREARETERATVLGIHRDAPLAYVFLKRKQILQTRHPCVMTSTSG